MSLTVTSINVNGVRAAVRQRSDTNLGLLHWLQHCDSQVVCLQEVRATGEQATAALAPALENGWHLDIAPSEIKGRSGVAILSKIPTRNVRIGYGDEEFTHSGRYIEADIDDPGDGDTVTIASLYLPSGSAGTPKQDEKERFLASFREFLNSRAAELADTPGHDMIVCGDWNIAHREADLKNHKANHKNSGFLPNERQWMTDVFADGSGWTDIVRHRRPDDVGPYTWWSNRGKAFDNDAGWRIDYHVVTDGLIDRAIADRVDRYSAHDLRWSDHAPVTVTYR